jgi:uncharacterized protein YrzB (UPF0473 family)
VSEQDFNEDPDEKLVTLVDEDGEEQDFIVIDTIELEGSRYAVLLPAENVEIDDEFDEDEVEDDEDEDDDEGEAIILKFMTDEEGNEMLIDIEDDEEWDKVADAWEKMVNEED